MRNQILITFIILFLFSCNEEKKPEKDNIIENSKPNIIVVLVDDMGYSDLGCYGSEINTPNLDNLASNGIRFTQFSNAARCCPTRAALLTGLHPHQSGIGYMEKNMHVPNYEGYINTNSITIAEGLKPAGYKNYIVGKWHVGSDRNAWPDKRGFDKQFSFINGATSFYELRSWARHDKPMHMLYNGEEYTPEGEDFYMTDAFTDSAVSFINKHNVENPFFMYLAYTAPHWPIHAKAKDIQKYIGKYKGGWDSIRNLRFENQKNLGLTEFDQKSLRWEDTPDWESLPDSTKEEYDRRMAVYAAMVDNMDQGVGKVVKSLEEKGILENTVIMFLSDNGGCPEQPERWIRKKADQLPQEVLDHIEGEIGSRMSFHGVGPEWANASNTPFRHFKSQPWRGGANTSFILYDSRIKEKGSINKSYKGYVTDIMTTCLDLAGVEYPSDKIEAEGISLVPFINGESLDGHDTLAWEHAGNKAIVAGDWKLLYTGWKHSNAKGEYDLFNLKTDPHEMNNVIDDNPEIAAQLKEKHQAWMNKVGALPWDSVKAESKKWEKENLN